MLYHFRLRSTVIVLLFALLIQGAITTSARTVQAKKATDWSAAMVESTMKRFPTAVELGSWGYAKSLYLYGQYLVYKRTGDPRHLQYVKAWIDSHVDANGVETNTNA